MKKIHNNFLLSSAILIQFLIIGIAWGQQCQRLVLPFRESIETIIQTLVNLKLLLITM